MRIAHPVLPVPSVLFGLRRAGDAVRHVSRQGRVPGRLQHGAARLRHRDGAGAACGRHGDRRVVGCVCERRGRQLSALDSRRLRRHAEVLHGRRVARLRAHHAAGRDRRAEFSYGRYAGQDGQRHVQLHGGEELHQSQRWYGRRDPHGLHRRGAGVYRRLHGRRHLRSVGRLRPRRHLQLRRVPGRNDSVRRNGLPSREGFPPERRQARAQVRARGRPRLRRFLGEHARAARMGGEARAQDRRRHGARPGSGRWHRR